MNPNFNKKFLKNYSCIDYKESNMLLYDQIKCAKFVRLLNDQ